MKHMFIAGILGFIGNHPCEGWNIFGFDICLGGVNLLDVIWFS